MKGDVVVIGSINMDVLIRTKEIPKIGETVIGEEIIENPGGKGANQAAALSKLETRVNFLGMIGNDSYGDKLLQSMKDLGIETKYIGTVKGSSGMAFITVDDMGNNNIIVIPGANHRIDKYYLYENMEVIRKSKIVLFQHEIPMDVVEEGIILSKGLGKTVVLNPAPAFELDKEILRFVDIIIPNEYELSRITNREISDIDSIVNASKDLIDKGVSKVITTMGDKGVVYVDEFNSKCFEAYKVNTVDTTAAGDSFIGGLLSRYLITGDIFDSIDFGQRVAAITVQRYGAQQSIPLIDEVNKYDFT